MSSSLLLQNNSMNGIYLRLPLRKKRDLKFARSYCVFIATIMTAGIKLQYAPFTLKKKFVKADYHLPKVVPAEDAFFSIFHSLGQLLSFFHSFFPFYCFFLFVLRLIPTSVFLSHFLSALKLFSLYLKRKKKNTQKTLHMGLFFCLKTRTREEISLDFFFFIHVLPSERCVIQFLILWSDTSGTADDLIEMICRP